MITPRLRQRPNPDKTYTARLVSGLQTNTYGPNGEVEIGAIGIITSDKSWDDRLWFIVISHRQLLNTSSYDIIGTEIQVRFRPAGYYTHTSSPDAGRLHSDARFYAVPADPEQTPRELVPVTELSAQCALPLHPDAKAASGNCNQHATSAVVVDERSGLYHFRCEEHRGLIRLNLTGPILDAVPQKVQFN